jgi:hypothetical protein
MKIDHRFRRAGGASWGHARSFDARYRSPSTMIIAETVLSCTQPGKRSVFLSAAPSATCRRSGTISCASSSRERFPGGRQRFFRRTGGHGSVHRGAGGALRDRQPPGAARCAGLLRPPVTANPVFLCFTGGAGAGKSALLAKFQRVLSTGDGNLLVLAHSADTGSTDLHRLLRRLCRAHSRPASASSFPRWNIPNLGCGERAQPRYSLQAQTRNFRVCSDGGRRAGEKNIAAASIPSIRVHPVHQEETLAPVNDVLLAHCARGLAPLRMTEKEKRRAFKFSSRFQVQLGNGVNNEEAITSQRNATPRRSPLQRSLRRFDYGLSTTFTQPSFLSRKVSYNSGASSSERLCVMISDGSISPFSIFSSNGLR